MIGETDDVLEVTEGMVGQKISVTATDADGKVLESLETDAVKGEDKSAEVSIVDDYGLQSDGTGIVTDRLSLSFGADFGEPRTITWYRDGAVRDTYSVGDTLRNGLSFTVGADDGVGTYYAVVVDANGKSHKSNEIVISANEDAAVIESFAIEDDYTDGSDIIYDTTDTKTIASVKMNKNFQGTFYLFKKDDTKYTIAAALDTMATAVNQPLAAAATVTSNTDGASVLTADAGTNYNTINKGPGAGIGYIAKDGKVTYKWNVSNALGTAGLVRGTEYVVVFDQTSKTEDNIGRGKENKFATACAAPYVTAPTKAEITKAAKNAPIEITFSNDDGVLTFMGLETARTGVLGTAGIGVKAGSDIYSATKTGLETKDATAKSSTLNNATSLKAGVWTSDITLTGTDAFWFANFTFNKGIYGKDEFTIRTQDKQVAYDAATEVSVSYDKASPKDLKVSFTNLRTDSTVYLVAVNDKTATTEATGAALTSDEGLPAAFTRIYNEPKQALASAEVTAGTSDYTFVGGIAGINVANGTDATLPGNEYMAVVIPKDETNYSPTHSGLNTTAAKRSVTITATLTKYKLGGTTTNLVQGASAFKLIGVDQFDKEIAFTAFNPVIKAATAPADAPADFDTAVPMTFAGATVTDAKEGSAITPTIANATTSKKFYAGTAWESDALSTGQKVVVTCTKTSAAAADATATFTVTLK